MLALVWPAKNKKKKKKSAVERGIDEREREKKKKHSRISAFLANETCCWLWINVTKFTYDDWISSKCISIEHIGGGRFRFSFHEWPLVVSFFNGAIGMLLLFCHFFKWISTLERANGYKKKRHEPHTKMPHANHNNFTFYMQFIKRHIAAEYQNC